MVTPRWIFIVGGGVASAEGLVCAVGFVVMIFSGNYRLSIQFLALTMLLLGTAIWLLRYRSNKVSPRVDADGEGTSFRPDRGLETPMQIAVFGMAVTWMYNAFTPSISTRNPILTVLAGWLTVTYVLLAVSSSLWLIRRDVRWGASKYLRLTPGGVDVVGGYGTRALSCEWGQIRNVTNVSPRRRGRRRWMSHTIVIVVSDTIVLRLPAGTFTPNGSALRDLVDFYWRHPEFRSELTDGSAPQRLGATMLISH